MATFAHNALHSFYKHMSEDLGEAKVTPQLLAQARELMADVLARHKRCSRIFASRRTV